MIDKLKKILQIKYFIDLIVYSSACMGGNPKVVEYLTNNGAIINAIDENNQSPLHLATQYGHVEVLKYLISNGATINIKDVNGMTPLHTACKFGPLEVVELLIENGGVEFINAKLKRKGFGWAPLHIAAQEGHSKIVEYLIQKGAKIGMVSNMLSITTIFGHKYLKT